MSTATNMYRLGDYVYVDAGPGQPYAIRRIDELQKSVEKGTVEALVMMYVRRAELPREVQVMADENLKDYWDEMSKKYPTQVAEREVFLTKQTETISAAQIRGKCSVSLLHKAESIFSYIRQEDTFFYTLVYDRTNETLFEDRGEIKIGSYYQAEVPHETLAGRGEEDTRRSEDLEELVWSPGRQASAGLSSKAIEQYLVLARSVGTFARAVDAASTLKQPSLHMSAAAASRDVTLMQAMHLLHTENYDFGRASLRLVEAGCPRLSTDQMEEWTTAEAGLFEEAMDKYGKGFTDIWTDFLPWKTVKNIVEYYYMWKTTDRYVQQKRVKAVESEQKLKQVYCPDYTKSETGALPPQLCQGATCILCKTTQATKWFMMPGADAMGIPHARICQVCWLAYRKYAAMSPGGMSKEFSLLSKLQPKTGKKATTLFLMSTLLARVARKLPRSAALNLRRVGRKPFIAVEQDLVRGETVRLVSALSSPALRLLLSKKAAKKYPSLALVTARCGYNSQERPEWLVPMAKDKLPRPHREAFPRKKGPGVKAGGVTPQTSQNRIKVASMARGASRAAGDKGAPEEIYFRSTKVSIANRNSLPRKVIKNLARRPTKILQ